MEKLILIDGNSLFNRAYYATPIFTTHNGTPTNAIFGFVKLLFKILDEQKPEYIIVAFDLKAPTFRHKKYTEYKANRKSMPEDLAAQFEPLRGLLKAMKIKTCAKSGYEADDVIGTLSKRFNVHSYIYTGDRDSFQLVDEKTDVYYTKKGVSAVLKLNNENFKNEIGLKPSQIVDLKALMGDKSDNIPGVTGIGEKTAYELLARYHNLDGIYENIDYLSNSVRNKLLDNKEQAYFSYELASIDVNCPIEVNLNDCVAPKRFDGDVKKIFTELEFNSLLSLDIFVEEANNDVSEIVYPETKICKSYDEVTKLLKDNNLISVSMSSEHLDIYAGTHECKISLAVDLLSWGIGYDEYVDILNYIFGNEENTIVAFGVKQLLHVLKSFNVEAKCKFEDVEIAKYLCDYNAFDLDFKGVCDYYLFDLNYSAFAVFSLHQKYSKLLSKENVLSLYENIEKPLIKVLFDMECVGVKVSLDIVEKLSDRYDGYISEYKNRIFEKSGCEFNLNSPTQLGEILYTRFGLKEVKKGKSNKYTTSAEVLEGLKDKNSVIDDILKYRLYQKLRSTYLEGYKPFIDKNTHLVHATYNQTSTTTGRLSCVSPNIQNIPIREDQGKEIRKIFIPKEGNVFIDADYSQIELRLLAHFSNCQELIDAYNSGIDIHKVTASQVFEVPIDDVTEKMRRDAKAVNFGIIYGLSDFGLSRNLNISLLTAREYIEKYFKTYSKVKSYMNNNVSFAKQFGYITTLTGRKRIIPEIKSANYNIRLFGERAAMNMPLQGSSADIIKIAMINVYNKLKNEGLKAKLILQVHDELVIDAPQEEVEQATKILKSEMENAVKLRVPLLVDVHIGKNWYDAK